MSSFCRRKLIGLSLLLCLLAGCSASGPTESSARAKLQKELDKWIGGDKESGAATFGWKIDCAQPPVSYKIRNVIATTPKLSNDAQAKLIKEDQHFPKDGAFLIVVDVEFKSQAGTPLTQVERYILNWIPSWNDWDIRIEP